MTKRIGAPTLPETIAFVRTAFAGIVDKVGQPCAEHCIRVMERLPSEATEDERHAALLHDILEDTPLGAPHLRERGYSGRTVMLVQELTRRPMDGLYLNRIKYIAWTRDAGLIRIKLSDIDDHLDPERVAALPPESRGLVRRYERAREILLAALPSSPPAAHSGEAR